MKDDDGNYKVTCNVFYGSFKYASTGLNQSKEIAKRKSAENMLKRLGDDYLVQKLPIHDKINNVADAKLYFVKHLRTNKNRSVKSAFDAVADDDGRSG